MIVQALFWTVDGVRHVRVDSVNPANVEEMHRFFLRSFPENGARLVTIDIEDDAATAETLRPSAPAPQCLSFCRSAFAAVPGVSVRHRCQLTEGHDGAHSYPQCDCFGPRAPIPTLIPCEECGSPIEPSIGDAPVCMACRERGFPK